MTTTAQDFGRGISPHAVGTLKARTRARLAGGVRMGTIAGDTGAAHGPRCYLETVPVETARLMRGGDAFVAPQSASKVSAAKHAATVRAGWPHRPAAR